MSELRKDLVSGDWVLIAPGRGKRPHQFRRTKRRVKGSRKSCPFENPKKAGNGQILLSYPGGKNWRLQVIPNRYPAVDKSGIWDNSRSRIGPFFVLPGYGYHEVVIPKEHGVNFPQLAKRDALFVLRAFRERYRNLAEDANISYISIFQNWGPGAGASIYHPHFQILAVPVIPSELVHSLEGAERYKKTNRVCVHCTQISWERKQKKRIVYENKLAVSFTPFVSKEPFEMRVFLKKHRPFFEDTTDEEIRAVTDALQKVLNKLGKALNDPDYNFFIHTAPADNREKYSYYHWHVEIVPRTNISAGFELGTAIEVNPLDPNEAAKFLRNV